MSIVVGIDPSLTGTAVCVWKQDDDYGPLLLKRFTSEPAQGVVARIGRYSLLSCQVVGEIMSTLSDSDPAIFIEGYSSVMKGNAAISLCEYGAVLREGLLGLTDTIIEIAPHSLKKFVTGKGNSDKEALRAHAAKRWGVIHDTSDETDAYSLARLGLAYIDESLCDNDAQRDVIAKLKNLPVKTRKRKAVQP